MIVSMANLCQFLNEVWFVRVLIEFKPDCASSLFASESNLIFEQTELLSGYDRVGCLDDVDSGKARFLLIAGEFSRTFEGFVRVAIVSRLIS